MSLARVTPTEEYDRSPLITCERCQRLNTKEDYWNNYGDCPQCQAPYKPEED